jgi:hypothetical protein
MSGSSTPHGISAAVIPPGWSRPGRRARDDRGYDDRRYDDRGYSDGTMTVKVMP